MMTPRAQYAPTRVFYEGASRPWPNPFGDLDPRMDLREADLEEGETGPAGTPSRRISARRAGFQPTTGPAQALATQLVDDTHTLYRRRRAFEFTLAQQANGAIGLLDEVASGKVTGEFWSHTDLWDFQANIDGARVLCTRACATS